MVAWHESQIFGVIVGGLIGGIGKIAYDFRKNKALKNNLERGIKSEVKILKDIAESSYNTFSGYRDFIKEKRKPMVRFTSIGTFKLSFTESNLEKVGILDEKFLVPLIEIKALLDVIPNAIDILHDTADRVAENSTTPEILDNQLDRAVSTFKRLSKLCDMALEHKSKISIFEILANQKKGVLKRIFKS